jgi:D-threo-aldose 1-dehydrogenase
MDITQLRPIGKTGLMVTPLCIGTAPLGDMPDVFAYSVSEDDALNLVREAFQNQPLINFIDTAYSYGDGEAERRIGLIIREIGGVPAGYIVASKADRSLQTGDFSGKQIRYSVERSLRLLGVDQIPMMYLHDPEHSTFDYIMSAGGAVDTLLRCRDEGLIGHVGLAGGPADLMQRYVETDAFEAIITHNRFTLLNRSSNNLINAAVQRGMGVMNAAPYGSGMLVKGPDAYPRYAYQEAPAEMIERTRKIEAICKEFGVRMPAAALQFSMRDPRVTSTIVGLSRPSRIAQTIDFASEAIPEAIWPLLDAVGFSVEDPELNRFT